MQPTCTRATVGANSVRPQHVRFYVAREHTVLPYEINCADQIQTERRGRRSLRYTIIITVCALTIWNGHIHNMLPVYDISSNFMSCTIVTVGCADLGAPYKPQRKLKPSTPRQIPSSLLYTRCPFVKIYPKIPNPDKRCIRFTGRTLFAPTAMLHHHVNY